jgi:hypothetical protein
MNKNTTAQTEPQTEINQAAYLAAIKEVRKIEAEHGLSEKDMVLE